MTLFNIVSYEISLPSLIDETPLSNMKYHYHLSLVEWFCLMSNVRYHYHLSLKSNIVWQEASLLSLIGRAKASLLSLTDGAPLSNMRYRCHLSLAEWLCLIWRIITISYSWSGFCLIWGIIPISRQQNDFVQCEVSLPLLIDIVKIFAISHW